ncbi:enoyl-CoA hydratase/isomerase family protein [Nocardioides endophyticus]|uniref:Enoyl-CoA hydratase/isomerase family protein n=1 Tax=Nocardioides endophyticus TaxID=1353775 RepID=A0ABP8YEG4_9ACTN
MNHIQSAVADAVGVITMARPRHANAINLHVAEQLTSAVTALLDRDDVHVLLLLGRGEHFCAGGDVKAMAAEPPEWATQVARTMHECIRALHASSKVIVAGAQGAVAGAGLSLALASDLVVATPETRFVAAWHKVGLTPDAGASWLLPRAVGSHRAAAMLVAGREVRGPEALKWGLVTELAAAADLQSRSHALAAEVASGAWRAAGATRSLLRSAWDVTLPSRLGEECQTIGLMRKQNQSELDQFLLSRPQR